MRPVGERATALLANLVGGAFLVLALLTAAEVLARKLLGLSLLSVDELGGYVYAIGSAAGFIIAFRDNAHVRVDLLLSRLAPPVRLVLHLASLTMLAGYAGLLAWRAAAQLVRSWELGAVAPTPMQTPLVLPQGLWFALLVIFALLITLRLVAVLRGLAAGRLGVDDAARSLDVQPVSAEVEDEVAALHQRQARVN